MAFLAWLLPALRLAQDERQQGTSFFLFLFSALAERKKRNNKMIEYRCAEGLGGIQDVIT
jgi:hypothetical protein